MIEPHLSSATMKAVFLVLALLAVFVSARYPAPCQPGQRGHCSLPGVEEKKDKPWYQFWKHAAQMYGQERPLYGKIEAGQEQPHKRGPTMIEPHLSPATMKAVFFVLALLAVFVSARYPAPCQPGQRGHCSLPGVEEKKDKPWYQIWKHAAQMYGQERPMYGKIEAGQEQPVYEEMEAVQEEPVYGTLAIQYSNGRSQPLPDCVWLHRRHYCSGYYMQTLGKPTGNPAECLKFYGQQYCLL
uniref:Basic tail protein n=1 Tax=Steinernema glaseri TaxID=37863 RepID=A0A1I8AL35_9BILA